MRSDSCQQILELLSTFIKFPSILSVLRKMVGRGMLHAGRRRGCGPWVLAETETWKNVQIQKLAAHQESTRISADFHVLSLQGLMGKTRCRLCKPVVKSCDRYDLSKRGILYKWWVVKCSHLQGHQHDWTGTAYWEILRGMNQWHNLMYKLQALRIEDPLKTYLRQLPSNIKQHRRSAHMCCLWRTLHPTLSNPYQHTTKRDGRIIVQTCFDAVSLLADSEVHKRFDSSPCHETRWNLVEPSKLKQQVLCIQDLHGFAVFIFFDWIVGFTGADAAAGEPASASCWSAWTWLRRPAWRTWYELMRDSDKPRSSHRLPAATDVATAHEEILNVHQRSSKIIKVSRAYCLSVSYIWLHQLEGATFAFGRKQLHSEHRCGLENWALKSGAMISIRSMTSES